MRNPFTPFTREAREIRRAVRLAKRAQWFRDGAKSAQEYANVQLYHAERFESEAAAILLRIGSEIQERKLAAYRREKGLEPAKEVAE